MKNKKTDCVSRLGGAASQSHISNEQKDFALKNKVCEKEIKTRMYRIESFNKENDCHNGPRTEKRRGVVGTRVVDSGRGCGPVSMKPHCVSSREEVEDKKSQLDFLL